MSDTPRTDAVTLVVTQMQVLPEEVVSAEFARELERENAMLREDRERLAKAAQDVLEYFILHKKVETGHPCPENMVICCTLRAAINAARKEGQP